MSAQNSAHVTVYIFCLFAWKDKATAERAIVDVANWEFYVLSTDLVNERLGDAKSVGLGRLRGLAERVGYAELKGKLTDSVCQLRYQDSTGAVQRNVSS